jgi:LemA protein
MTWIVVVVIVVLVLALLWVALLYNGLVQKRNRVDNAWAQIEVQLKRLHDLIPNLVETSRAMPPTSAARSTR